MPKDEVVSFPKIKEEAQICIPQCIDRVLGKIVAYHPKNVEEWNEAIGQGVLEKLQELSNNFKYLVNVIIVEKRGGGIHTSSAVFWDTETDGAVTYRWENKAMVCVVQAFGIGM
mmetsp:Transcript_39846/g.70053  ORF Transcript_39846/g.70053 Transcript_39846/m.70053 type:complete len:114 (-) Transcript_39846:72-413(-)